MGVDLVAIVPHSMSAAELSQLPSMLDALPKIKNLRQEGLLSQWSEEYVHQFYTKFPPACWSDPRNQEAAFLGKVWDNWQQPDSISSPEELDNNLETYWSWITVQRHYLLVELNPWHKYGNLRNAGIAKAILSINRELAHSLHASEILYCVDSGFPPQLIYDRAIHGKEFPELKTLAEQQFGLPPKGIQEGMKNVFFYDDLNENLDHLESWERDEMYWDYDFEKKKYFHKGFGPNA